PTPVFRLALHAALPIYMVPSDLRLALDGIGAPTAVIDLAAFDSNLEALAKRARGLPIRVATKSLRTPAAIERALSHPDRSPPARSEEHTSELQSRFDLV